MESDEMLYTTWVTQWQSWKSLSQKLAQPMIPLHPTLEVKNYRDLHCYVWGFEMGRAEDKGMRFVRAAWNISWDSPVLYLACWSECSGYAIGLYVCRLLPGGGRCSRLHGISVSCTSMITSKCFLLERFILQDKDWQLPFKLQIPTELLVWSGAEESACFSG